jgi:hypothetical protein
LDELKEAANWGPGEVFKYWRSRSGPLRFCMQFGKKVRKRKAPKKARKAEARGFFSSVVLNFEECWWEPVWWVHYQPRPSLD